MSVTGMTPDGKKRQVGLQNMNLLWTTPQAHDSAGGSPDRVKRHGTKHGDANLADDVTLWATPTSHPRTHTPRQVDHGEQLANQADQWATPTSRDWRSDSSQKSDAEIYGTKGRPLGRQALQSEISGPPSSPSGPTSSRPSRPQKQWSTPQSADAVGSTTGTHQRGGGKSLRDDTARALGSTKVRLNPRFVCWLMGLPLGWTDLEPLEIVAYHNKSRGPS